ncbi:MAG: sensor histidine kinase [Bacteroidetes bacterium]|nr:sensor histidine kinase [Bacteroidota bacterium]
MGRFIKYIIPALYGLLVYFTIRLLLDSVTGMKFWHRSWQLNSIEITTSVIMGYFMAWVLRRLFHYFDKSAPAKFSYSRIAKELFYVFLVNQIVVNLFMDPLVIFTDDGMQLYDFFDVNVIPLLYSIIFYGIFRSSSFLRAYIDNKILLEKITNDKLQTELKFLKAQYHPHFLFNALNTIYFQMDENVADAKKSVEKFSELLRYQLYDQQQQVSMKQEMEYLENFIELQKVRVSEKLKLDVRLDKNLNGQQVYPLLFLPLVENAFKYVSGDYSIAVNANVKGNEIRFTVGNSIQCANAPTKPNGIGLENLKRRLDLLYPNRHSLTTEKKGDYFFATMNLQLEEDEHKN